MEERAWARLVRSFGGWRKKDRIKVRRRKEQKNNRIEVGCFKVDKRRFRSLSLTGSSSADLRWAISRTEALVSPLVSTLLDHTQSKPAHLQRASVTRNVFPSLHENQKAPQRKKKTAFDDDSTFFLSFEQRLVPPWMRANIARLTHKTLSAVQQNTAYVIMLIYLFIVCNHATEPFFFLNPERKGKQTKMTAVAVMQEPGGEAAENVTQRSVIPTGLGLGAASPLSPPQD